MGEDGYRTDGEVGLEGWRWAGTQLGMPLSGGRGDGVSNGDVQGVARSTQRVDQIGVRGRHKVRARHTKD